MKKSEMKYNPLFDRLWGMDGINPFGHPTLLELYLENNLQDYLDECILNEDYEKAAEIQKKLKIIWVPDNLSLTELSEFLNRFPEKEYKFLIYEFNKK